MRRRDFISLLGGAVVGRPFAAQAQQTGKVSRIGYLGASSASLEQGSWTLRICASSGTPAFAVWWVGRP